jgi:integrase
MPRRVRASTIETRTARLKLEIRRKPHAFTTIAPGIAVGYRRCAGPGRWVLRAANGHGGYWTEAIGLADDHEEADGEQVLTFWQAQDKARTLVRGKDNAGHRPATVSEALGDYARDLEARGGEIVNARYPRNLLTPALLAKPVALLTSKELRHWRDSLLATRAPSSVNRVGKMLAAALSLAARHDQRITNSAAWKLGLAALPDAHVARHVGLPEKQVRAIVCAAYAIEEALGLWAECAAVTGARPSQLARLEVADLQIRRGPPRLMMPSSRKGKGRKRVERRPVPIPRSLASRLQQAAQGRRPDEPLLRRGNGSGWGKDSHIAPFAAAAVRSGLDGTTAYSLRHSSIIRSLLAGTPTRVVAALHDTSVAMLERSYAQYILDHSDTVARRALLDLGA